MHAAANPYELPGVTQRTAVATLRICYQILRAPNAEGPVLLYYSRSPEGLDRQVVIVVRCSCAGNPAHRQIVVQRRRSARRVRTPEPLDPRMQSWHP